MVQFKHLRSFNKNMNFFAISTGTVAMATRFVGWNASFGPFFRRKIWKTKKGFGKLLLDNQTADEYQTFYRRIFRNFENIFFFKFPLAVLPRAGKKCYFWPINGSHSKNILNFKKTLCKKFDSTKIYMHRKNQNDPSSQSWDFCL